MPLRARHQALLTWRGCEDQVAKPAAHQAQVQADHDAASADSAKKFPEYFQAEETTK